MSFNGYRYCNMKMQRSFIILLMTCFLCIHELHASDCTKISACACNSSDGMIDLAPLASSGNVPRFKDVMDAAAGSYVYSWNPCSAFSEGDCKGVAGCQTDTRSLFFNLGTQESAKFINDATRGLVLSYTATADATRTLNVNLICDVNIEADLNVIGENPPGSSVYEMVLTSKYCCSVSITTTTTRSATTTPRPCRHIYSDDIISMVLIAILIGFIVLLLMCSIIICLLVRHQNKLSHILKTPPINQSTYHKLN